MTPIPFNKPYITGDELKFIEKAMSGRKFSGDGPHTQLCQDFFEKNYSFTKAFLTTSCTDALELAAIAADIQPGDEVIVPSYTFVSTANAFVLRGAKIVFADSNPLNPNIDVSLIESLITSKTKALVPVHYAGVACNMDKIMELAENNNLIVIEDAAQGIHAFFKEKALGGIGHYGAVSFHETKNVMAGEGGMILVNDPKDVNRTEVIREKGTNRASFIRGEVDEYKWVDKGSSFLPSDLIAAFLYGQLIHLDTIQSRRIELWKHYYLELKLPELERYFRVPVIDDFSSNNGHIFYIVCNSRQERAGLIAHLKKMGILASFHYQALHQSPFFRKQHDGRVLPFADKYSDCLLRLPLFFELEKPQISFISQCIREYYQST